MIEGKADIELPAQFERYLAGSMPADQAPDELQADLRIAHQLKGLNLSAESQIRDRLRERLAQKIQRARPGRSIAWRQPAHSRIWLGAAAAVLMFLFLVTNSPTRAALERLFGWMTADQAGSAPTQVLTMVGYTPTYTGTAGLPLHPPEHTLDRSPTPGAVQPLPDAPIAVPTPSAKASH